MQNLQISAWKGNTNMQTTTQQSNEEETTKNKIPRMKVRTDIRSGDCTAWCQANCPPGIACSQQSDGSCRCSNPII